MSERAAGGVKVETELVLEHGRWTAKLLYQPDGAPGFKYPAAGAKSVATNRLSRLVKHVNPLINEWVKANKPDARFDEFRTRWNRIVAEQRQEA